MTLPIQNAKLPLNAKGQFGHREDIREGEDIKRIAKNIMPQLYWDGVFLDIHKERLIALGMTLNRYSAGIACNFYNNQS